MSPYRSWYAANFSAQMAEREANVAPWAKDVRVIADRWGGLTPDSNQNHRSQATYEYIDSKFGANQVMYHDWDPRADAIDSNHPSHRRNPKRWPPEIVFPTSMPPGSSMYDFLRNYGIRSMGYVNANVVNVGGEAFQTCGIVENAIGIPRKYNYWDDIDGPVQPTYSDVGALLYTDTSNTNWRQYHINQMSVWSHGTSTPLPYPAIGACAAEYSDLDATYEDTGGFGGDQGNGVVDGFFGGQGEVELFSHLLTDVSVPMATEYGTDSVGFASQWNYRANHRWNYCDTATNNWRQWLTVHQRPVSTYLFGPGLSAWVATAAAYDNVSHYALVAYADALGSVAPYSASYFAYDAQRGDYGHMNRRARFFAEGGLVPVFPTESWLPDTVSMYEAANGTRYRYSSEVDANGQPTIQKLTNTNGSQVYARGARRLSMRS